jgi:C-terminal domain of Sin3a protein
MDTQSLQADSYKTERFDVFIGGILSAMTGTLDANKYEDFARQLLGSRAYLLFSFDKLITTVKLFNIFIEYRLSNTYSIWLMKKHLRKALVSFRNFRNI